MPAREPRTESPRRSIEVEYWVIDDAGRLDEPGALVDAAPGVEREFVEPLLEIKTTPCETTRELGAELFDRLERVLDRADELGKALVPLGTTVSAEEVRELPRESTAIQNRAIGERFEYTRHCAGTHVHVEQRPGRVIDQLNALTALDPALALVNSAPFFRGKYLAAGARTTLYRRMAYADHPRLGQLWPYAESEAEWERRLDRRYEEFVTAATAAGVDRQAVEANFDREDAVWAPVQRRDEFSTVEWRSPDAALPSRVIRLADRVTRVVERAGAEGVTIGGEAGRVTDDGVALPEFDAVLRYVDDAVAEGLDSTSLRSYLRRMGFDVDAYDPASHELAGRGTIGREAARRLRLDHAARLERDVRRTRVVVDDAPVRTETE